MTGIKYQIQETIYDAKSMLDENNFYNQRQGSPSQLTKKLTYIMGDYKRKYPIATMTEGGIGYGISSTSVELDDVQFTYPAMGETTKVSHVVKTDYSGSDKPGIGNGFFNIYFADNWIKRFYIIQSTRGVQAYVTADLEPQGDGTFKAVCQLDPAGPADYCALTELEVGTPWIELHTAVAESESRTTESKMAMPGEFKNQMGFARAGISWAGNSAEKMMKITVKTEKGETSVWMDFAMWQFEDNWLDECEHLHWYSRYNRLANGTIPLKDLLTGKVIPRGSGLLEQIQNKTSYSSLNYDAFTNKVGDAIWGSNNAGKSLTLHTGTGGKREFHKMVMTKGATLLGSFGAGDIASKFVTGTGYNLALGGYFDALYHIDGILIKVKYNEMFDFGRVAKASQLHPESGLPLESYRMVFIDDNEYEGQSNIRHVSQKGRAFQHGIVAGLTTMPKSLAIMGGFNITSKDAVQLLSTDQDKSGYTRLKSSGIQIMNAERCFDMQCIAGL
jgi:hypothetical protein